MALVQLFMYMCIMSHYDHKLQLPMEVHPVKKLHKQQEGTMYNMCSYIQKFV